MLPELIRRLIYGAALVGALIVVQSTIIADEGMYPISEIHKLRLDAKGLKIDPKEVYNPEGISLIDAIVQVGGCTGSFVSPEGLVLTNHHCAFGAVQAISTKDSDYITLGFLASTRSEERPARGYTVRITESYRDVSKEVLDAVTGGADPAERSKAIEKRMNELVKEAEKANPGKRASVSEMFAGRTYVLFVYATFRDVRLVYVPPRSIGEFGGENDNWIWPRHTGDFSFVRVYVAPDGSPAEYSPDNVPYKPKKYLPVQPKGVDEGDFVFILGYPGRTFRHRTSHYLDYEEHYRMPYMANLYEWQIGIMEEMGKDDRALAIKFDSRIKGLANVMKNYRGKLQGMRRLQLVDKKREEEKGLQAFIDADRARQETYGTVLADIGAVYREITANAESELVLSGLGSASMMLAAASAVVTAEDELRKADDERMSAYTEKNFPRTKENVLSRLADFHEPTDKIFLREFLLQAFSLPANQRPAGLESLFGGTFDEATIDAFVERAYATTVLKNRDELAKALEDPAKALQPGTDPLLSLAQSLKGATAEMRARRERHDGALNRLYGLLVDVKEQWKKTAFIPDANSTLRLTYGYVKGYSPADATTYSAITTLGGVLEKTTGQEPYNTPEQVLQLAKRKQYGRFAHPRLGDVPVALLYNLDTTGGNSGSPLINAYGELVGVNFDRAWEATINDYAWSDSYSRSIAVDVRYVLWVTQNVGGAQFLLDEMGVK